MSKNADLPNRLHKVTRKYLQGGMSRRDFLRHTAAMGLTLPLLNSVVSRVKAQDGMMTSADRAVQVVREKYAGESLTATWEAGLQAQDPLLFSGPMWQELTGVSLNIVEVNAGTELFSRQLNEHIAQSGAFDVLQVQPNWLADYALAGVLEPLDDYVAEYMNPADLEDFPPIYRGLDIFEGRRYGLFDDGDTLLLYYRKDLFEQHGDEFADEMGYALAPPANWKEADDIARFFTQKLAPDVYGAAYGRTTGWNWMVFIPHFKANGGRFFDPDTMSPLINGAEGVRTVAEMRHINQWMPPGIEGLTAIDTFQEWLAGRYAMTWFWPPLGRWSAGYAQQAEQMAFLPESQVAGKVGYALLPGDITEMAVGFSLGVASGSPNKELAYLFIQWLNSPEISLQRVTLPFALRDPFRIGHFESEEYRGLWDDAGDYLDTLMEAGEKASLDLLIPGGQEYSDALDRACTAAYAGMDPQQALDVAAQEFEEITDRLGRDRQKQAYANYLTLDGAYPSANLVDAPSNVEM
jgi:multiple sugar transport system substrate-binding protein